MEWSLIDLEPGLQGYGGLRHARALGTAAAAKALRESGGLPKQKYVLEVL